MEIYMTDKKLWISLSAAVAALAALCIILLIVLIVIPPKGGPDLPTNNQDGIILGKTEDKGQSYLDKIVFLGDSNTAHLCHPSYTEISGMVKDKQIWTGDGSTLMLDIGITGRNIIYPETNEAMTIAAAAAKKKPEILIITLGYNGKDLSDDEFIAAYENLIKAVKEASPETKIIAQSLFPVRRGTGVSDPQKTNARLDVLNGHIKDVAKKQDIKYLDTQAVLKDSSGILKAEYSSQGGFSHEDGYHLSDIGLKAVLDYIKTHAYTN